MRAGHGYITMGGIEYDDGGCVEKTKRRESHLLSLYILVGIFHYRSWLVYSNDGLPQNAPGFREQASCMHTH